MAMAKHTSFGATFDWNLKHAFTHKGGSAATTKYVIEYIHHQTCIDCPCGGYFKRAREFFVVAKSVLSENTKPT